MASPLNPETGSLDGTAAAQRADREADPQSLLPWIIAGVVVLVGIGVLLLAGGHKTVANPGGAGLAPPAAYASHLVLNHVQMSESANLSGGKLTYLDGEIANHGDQTLRAITVQVAFHNAGTQLAQKETMPLNLIRTRQPYVDIQPVSAAPLTPGATREFRLIFDHVAEDWDQQYPEVRVIAVETR